MRNSKYCMVKPVKKNDEGIRIFRTASKKTPKVGCKPADNLPEPCGRRLAGRLIVTGRCEHGHSAHQHLISR